MRAFVAPSVAVRRNRDIFTPLPGGPKWPLDRKEGVGLNALRTPMRLLKILLIAGMVLALLPSLAVAQTAVPGDALTLSAVDRVWGATRYSGSVAIARDTFDTGPAMAGTQWGDIQHIIIASGEDRAAADPLAAAGLVGVYEAPLFLVSSTSVAPEVIAAIEEIVAAASGPVTIRVVGGPVSVPDAVLGQILAAVDAGADLAVGRVRATGDRYDLAWAIAEEMMSVEGTAPTTVLLANGADSATFFDALALSPIAASEHIPILLVSRYGLPLGTANALDSIAPDPETLEIIIGGGPNTISPELEDAFVSVLGDEDVTRWSGATRYETALAIADAAVGRGWLTRDIVGVAARLPDALSGGAAVGLQDGVLVLTASTGLTPSTAAWLQLHSAEIDRVIVFGGPQSIPQPVVDAIDAAAAPVTP